MKKILSRALLLALLLLCLSPLFPEDRRNGVRVAVVQLAVDESITSSVEAFRRRMEGLIVRAAAYEPDLVIFPEYTGVFCALIPYHRAIKGAGSLEEALKRLREVEPLASSLKQLFLLNTGLAERLIAEIFGRAARRYDLFILAGSYFAYDRGPAGEAQLKNRALLFDREGRQHYTQDKVYLTDFESDILELTPGSLDRARSFRLEEQRVGLTICRDSYFASWERILAGIDLWIDIKANGTPFTPEQRESFRRAVPARIKAAGVPFGITACLTGSYLDLLWEGESSLAQNRGDSVRYLIRAASPREEEILLLAVEASGKGAWSEKSRN